ncbi:MAG: ATP-binding protein [Acidobacteriota bacterium]
MFYPLSGDLTHLVRQMLGRAVASVRTTGLPFAVAAALSGVVLASTLSAQQYVTRQYGFGDGLTSPIVRSLAEGPDGRIWAALRTGVFWSDGSSWYQLQASPNMATHMAFDGDQLLAGSTYRRLDIHRYSSGEWTRLNEATRTRQAISLASARIGSERFWLAGTFGGELWRIDSSGEQEHIVLPELTGSPILDVDYWRQSWWLSTGEALWKYEGGGSESLTKVRDSATLGVAVEGGSAFFVGVESYGRLEPGDVALPLGESPVFGVTIGNQLAADGNRGLWLGNREGLWWLGSDGAIENASSKLDLEGKQVESLLVDSFGALWVGTDAGLIRLISRQFSNVSARDGLEENEVTAVRPLDDGRILLTTPRFLYVIEGKDFATLESFRVPGGPGLRIADVERSPDGSIWVAGGAGTLFRFTPRGLWVTHSFDHDVLSVRYAGGQLWVGTSSAFYLWDGQGFEEIETVPETGFRPAESRTGVRVIQKTAGGDLLLSTLGAGLVRFDPEKKVPLRQWLSSDPSPAGFWAAVERADGTVVVCATGGLLQGRDGKLERVDWFPQSTSFSIFEDDRQDLWIGAVDGLYRWDGESLESFDVLNGLASHELNRNALVQIDNELWIGGDRGLSLLDLDHDTPKAGVKFVFDQLSADGVSRALTGTEDIRLPSTSARISFSAFGSSPPESLEISHRLEGLKNTWSEPYPLRTRWMEFSLLPPGRYRLALRGRSVGSEWSEAAMSPWFVVPRAWWQSRLFWLASAASLFLFVALGISFWMQRRYARLLEAELDERWTELKASEQRWGQVLQGIAEGVVAVSEDGRLQAVNPAAAMLLEIDEERALGRLFEDLAPSWLAQLSPLPGESHREITATFEREGAEREIDIAMRRIASGGAHALSGGAVWILRDVTERSRLQEQQKQVERLESLGLLAGGIAHDFNNLLTVVSANLSLVGMDSPPECEPLVDEADRAIDRARDLTRQLLTFSRGGEPVRKMVDPASILLDAATLALSGTGVALDRRGIRPIPICSLDRGQIHQVFNNLVLNAAESMKGKGTVRIGCGVAGDRAVQLWVEDEGPGMDPSVLSRIFDPYFSTKKRGSGLGLTTAFSIAARHGGSLSVRSTLGEGTRFTVELPVGEGSMEEGTQELTTPELRGGRILLMDDEAPIREVMRRILERHGYEVEVAANGSRAIERCKQAATADRPYDLAILDLTVPGGMGGAETCRELRRRFPRLPAIVSSGYADLPVMSQHREYGFVDVLPKPFSADELLRKVGRALASSVPIVEGRDELPVSPVWSGQGDRQLN